MAIVTAKKETKVASFLRELMHRRKRLPSQIAADLGVSHATVHRWLAGEDTPYLQSCQRIAEYSGMTLSQVLAGIGRIPEVESGEFHKWPEFREYAKRKYSDLLDEDLITMIEDLIERKRLARKKKGFFSGGLPPEVIPVIELSPVV